MLNHSQLVIKSIQAEWVSMDVANTGISEWTKSVLVLDTTLVKPKLHANIVREYVLLLRPHEMYLSYVVLVLITPKRPSSSTVLLPCSFTNSVGDICERKCLYRRGS
ncbi:hypothetical protein BAUCODRAFT_382186 [Baudoinia panamericana UAMH 10762]|uniref:Uncharacterized protein n=1 Tax=Baudoinia panamericana (strain UAMH 10762) TaxID=717646 RepID=M2MPZ2_BAUPA|nr:uncharacterized protein BAUCODRAFT_382186 [Baudoinia panamericana UAMH 10762]EMC98841.1 hypothetical protein BAUCODRAFT_382186 [Baudoinia panamericana UAMH 10762]